MQAVDTEKEEGVKEALQRYFDKTGILLFLVLLTGIAFSVYTGFYPAAAVFILLVVIAVLFHQQVVVQSDNEHDLLYSTLDGCPDGVLVLDSGLTCSYCNEQACIMLGLSAAEICGRELPSLICDEGEAAALSQEIETVERVIRTGGLETVFEATFYRRGKTPYPVEYRVSAIMKGKKVAGALLFFQDVTAQRRIEALLNEKVDVLEGLEKRGKIGFWEWDIVKKELYMSKQFRRFLSADLKEPVIDDSRFLQYVHGDDLSFFNDRLKSLLASHRIIEITFRTLPQQGDITVLHCFGRTEYGQMNQPLKVNGFCLDITEKKGLESRIAVLEQELAGLKNRPHAGERSPHAVDTLRFLTGMSHDLRTPLNSILGFAQLHLQKSCEAGGDMLEQQNCQRIIESGKHLLQLISDVIDYAKIEAKELSLTMGSYSLAGIVRESLEICAVDADHKAVRLILEQSKSENEIWIRVDRDRLRQVIVNLVTHIIVFCKGRESILIRYASTENGLVKIEIIDCGHVIPLDKVLPIFSEVDSREQQRKMQEMELKLAIAKRLVEQMEGALLLESDTMKGNAFSLQVKPGEAGVEPVAEQVLPVSQTGSPVEVGSEYSILYIEDNAANRQLVKSVLKRNINYILLEAENGAAGLALAKEKRPDCILLDLNLPDMSGYDVIEDLKKDPLTSTIPVIALSGEVSPEEKENAQQAGFDSFIGKPINVAEFRQTVDRVLAR